MPDGPEWKAHVGKVSVALHVMGSGLEPEELTSALGLDPSETDQQHAPGVFSPEGISAPEEVGRWTYETENKVESRDANDHLRHLLRLFLPRKSAIEDLRPLPKVWVSVYWESTVAGSGVWPMFEADCISGLAELGARLSVEVVKIGDQEES